jgi:hypothetical protein
MQAPSKPKQSYCLSYAAVLVTLAPLELVPVVVTVRLFPSAATTMRPVVVILPFFLTVNANVWAPTLFSDRASEFGLRLIEEQMGQLDQEMADLLRPYQDQVQRLAEMPGLGVDSAHQIIAEVGATAATFPSEKHLSSWVGACPGDTESAGVNYSHRSPKGNRNVRRLLNQSANAAVRAKGSIFEIVYRRTVPRLGHKQTIGAVAHRQCRLIWKILHQGARYEERGAAVNTKSRQRHTARMIRELRSLGYRVEPASPKPATNTA